MLISVHNKLGGIHLRYVLNHIIPKRNEFGVALRHRLHINLSVETAAELPVEDDFIDQMWDLFFPPHPVPSRWLL